MIPKHVYIIADIEGSSLCFDYESSRFMTEGWPRACAGMTADVEAVVSAIRQAGVEKVTVKDFHRTGFNLMAERIPGGRVVSGYIGGPVAGFGSPSDADAVIYMGMHSSSGSNGFLAHTLTSRIAKMLVNGKETSELELFSSALYSYGMKPLFFSGCPVACKEAEATIPGMITYPIDKFNDYDPAIWRKGLAEKAVASLKKATAQPFTLQGPFEIELVMRDGEKAAKKWASTWNLEHRGESIFFSARDGDELWMSLAQTAFLTPLLLKILPVSLFLYNIVGRAGLQWVRRKV
jgi:D-amino peptidase